MKNLKAIFAMTFMVMIVMSSCGKEEVATDLQSESVDKLSTFISANEDNDPHINVNEIINQSNYADNTNSSTDDRCPCGINSFNDVTSPWGDVNLNIQYDIITDAQVRVFHYLNVGNSWSYQGYDTIYGNGYSGSPACAPKNVNMSTGQVPTGTICSIAKVWTGSNYCGSSYYDIWSH